jgi:hypothetical protein
VAEEVTAAAARAEIDELTRVFFGAFTNKAGPPGVDGLYRLFLPQAVIMKRTGATCEVYDLKEFIEPRRQLLTNGSLVDFSEEETAARTDIFGGIAQRFCTYRKAGVLSGRPFSGRGVKTIQFIRLGAEWKISALAWEDERDDLPLAVVQR